MNPKISILGCGWLGSALSQSLVKKGCTVYGSTRSESKPDELKGIKHFTLDISDTAYDYTDFLASDVLVIPIPSKEVSAFAHLIRQIEASGIKKVLYTSSTSVYPFTNGTVTEETPTKDTPLTQIEGLFRVNPHFQTTILRFGGLFGYKRKPGNFVKPGRKMKHPEGYINLIHQDDCVRIMEAIIEQDVWGQTFNAVSDSHPKRRDFYTQEAAKVGKSQVEFDEESENLYKIVSNQKLKKTLGYAFVYADLMQYE